MEKNPQVQQVVRTQCRLTCIRLLTGITGGEGGSEPSCMLGALLMYRHAADIPISPDPHSLPNEPTRDGRTTRLLVCCNPRCGGRNLPRHVSFSSILIVSTPLTNTNSESPARVLTDIAYHQFKVKMWVDAVKLYNKLYHAGRIIRIPA